MSIRVSTAAGRRQTASPRFGIARGTGDKRRSANLWGFPFSGGDRTALGPCDDPLVGILGKPNKLDCNIPDRPLQS